MLFLMGSIAILGNMATMRSFPLKQVAILTTYSLYADTKVLPHAKRPCIATRSHLFQRSALLSSYTKCSRMAFSTIPAVFFTPNF